MNSLLPPNSTKFEINFEQTFSRISAVEIPTRTFNDSMSAPLEVLPFLAWEKSVDVWNKNWTEQQKRQTVASSLKSHLHKGTIGALETALGSLGFRVKVQEWFNMAPVGKPYTFKLQLEASQESISSADLKDVLNVVNKNKNLRSHLISQSLTVTSNLTTYFASAICIGHDIEYLTVGGLYLDGSWYLNGLKNLDGNAFEKIQTDGYIYLDGIFLLNGNNQLTAKKGN